MHEDFNLQTEPVKIALPKQHRFRGHQGKGWQTRLRFALLLPIDSKWNAWVRDFTAWLERIFK